MTDVKGDRGLSPSKQADPDLFLHVVERDVYKRQGYEIAGAFGAKLAEPDKEVYALVGDGSFMMLNSCLLYTSLCFPFFSALLFTHR